MVKIPKTSWLENQEKYFDNYPTFESARNIWLYCFDNKKPVPKNVEDFFVKRLREYNEVWLDKIGYSLQKEQDSMMFDWQIIEMREAGMTYKEIAFIINESFPDVRYTDNAIRKRYKKAIK